MESDEISKENIQCLKNECKSLQKNIDTSNQILNEKTSALDSLQVNYSSLNNQFIKLKDKFASIFNTWNEIKVIN